MNILVLFLISWHLWIYMQPFLSPALVAETGNQCQNSSCRTLMLLMHHTSTHVATTSWQRCAKTAKTICHSYPRGEVPLPNPGWQRWTSMFSSKGFIALILTSKPMILFEWIFVYVWDKGPNSFFCMWTFSCLNTIYWKDKTFHVELSGHLGWKSIDRKSEDSLLNSQFYSTVGIYLLVYGYAVTILCWLPEFYHRCWNQESSNFIPLLQTGSS